MASSEYEVRLKKLELLRSLGVDYPYRYDPTHTVDELKENFREGLKVRIAGRVMTKRPFGKLIFSHLRGADIQIMIQRGKTPEDFFVGLDLERYEGSKNPAKIYEKLIDIGDVIGVEGETIKTKTGEPTVLVERLTLLVKSLHPLPEKWHGIQDPELPFKTYSNALETDLYLRIATELSLKKLLVGGFSRIYEVGKNFRNEGIDATHYPEFTALEAYAAYWDREKA